LGDDVVRGERLDDPMHSRGRQLQAHRKLGDTKPPFALKCQEYPDCAVDRLDHRRLQALANVRTPLDVIEACA
jgi:hypothetical protein